MAGANYSKKEAGEVYNLIYLIRPLLSVGLEAIHKMTSGQKSFQSSCLEFNDYYMYSIFFLYESMVVDDIYSL